ncbi:hypothetical protein [Acinetobacter zhairhuonensis]|uniref:hypothetical protein n=1 Tax=Acinetobacter sp. A7.4 TaxID=2919921 RepID=UPI001F4FF88A|nr:hypothetical protein [Acinetobacter sp. A7.4]MCJ8161855.1 hypothetical protein [Acinetobacter sp. A7.4]
MSVIPSLFAGLAQLQALANYIDQGSNNATLVFYDDSKPSSTLIDSYESARLVSLSLPKPCLRAVNVNSISLEPTEAGTVIKTGTAIWARLINGNGDTVADFSVGADITLNSADMVLGGTVSISAITFTPTT